MILSKEHYVYGFWVEESDPRISYKAIVTAFGTVYPCERYLLM